MDIFFVIFSVIGLAFLAGGYALEGGHVAALGQLSAAVIVIGGTIGAVGVAFPIGILKRVPAGLKVLLMPRKVDLPQLVSFFKEISYKTRKNGLLSLENEITNDANMDPFIKKGLQLVVDGVDPEAVRSILELEVDSVSERHKELIGVFESAGGFAPTMGIIGTVMGLVHVLGNMSEPDKLAGAISAAFIATLYGIATANLLYLPMGSRLKNLDNKEYKEKTMIVEGILYIQEGINPNTIAEKLKGFLDKQELKKYEEMDGKAQV